MFDAYLKIDGIPGECEDKGHEQWIQLLSFSHGVQQLGTNLGGGGNRGSSGKAEHQHFSFTKYVDKASPKLNLHCSNGQNLKKVTVEICRQVDSRIAYLTYTFEPCLVSSVQIGGSTQGDDRPVEQVSFNYTKIEWKYTEVAKDNTPGGDTMAHWDLSTNTGG
ncbi:type VI secretion system tube protein Hcp [Luteolibacter sp. SL250]|uniref:Hcp family type VI secretion system effector n=1 Tax=Luteolibacter sp. SL250 TaxID=2995170 RepID=UPI0022717B74|nr:type VI secretion system tube protein Hcp [Luteolibacter sp. SL250]WAC17858.1 type VI secretion system tube protein Hcp [Luteolibacter sp. SL250]